MSNDFKKVSIIDDRLNTTDSLNYGVFRGGQNVTNIRMPAISTTANSLNFQIPFPSESTVLDREVFIQTQTRYFFELTTPALGMPVYGPPPLTGRRATDASPIIGHKCPIIYGNNISMAAFPTQRTCSTIQVQLNNNYQHINNNKHNIYHVDLNRNYKYCSDLTTNNILYALKCMMYKII